MAIIRNLISTWRRSASASARAARVEADLKARLAEIRKARKTAAALSQNSRITLTTKRVVLLYDTAILNRMAVLPMAPSRRAVLVRKRNANERRIAKLTAALAG